LTGATLSYRQLIDAVRRATAGFAAQGVAKGDVVVLCSPNRPEFVIAYYAALAAGGVVTTINPMVTAAELGGQLNSAGARWMVTTLELFELTARDAAATAQLREVFVFGAAAGAMLLDEVPPAPFPEMTADDRAVLLYSSGTTGLPKAVALSHRNLVASLCQTRLV
jgi:acyl-CoA synthetase (AMP-forming)/AMP-acid ligase II